MTQVEQATDSPRFASILVARSNTDRPTDLEVALRCHCVKVRVHQRLSGAHLILPNESSLSVRIYYPAELLTIRSDNSDGIQGFAANFKWKVVFFVLPQYSDIRSQQFNDCSSFYRRTLRLLDDMLPSLTDDNSVAVNPCWVLVVSNTDQAVSGLMNIADAISPLRQSHQQEFFRRQRSLFFLDDNSEKEASKHVAAALRKWADRAGMAQVEADVLLRLLFSLEAVITADESVLQGIPVDTKSKAILGAFFGRFSSLPTNSPLFRAPVQEIQSHPGIPFQHSQHVAQQQARQLPIAYRQGYYYHGNPTSEPPVIAHRPMAPYDLIELPKALNSSHPGLYVMKPEAMESQIDASNHALYANPAHFYGVHESRSVFHHNPGLYREGTNQSVSFETAVHPAEIRGSLSSMSGTTPAWTSKPFPLYPSLGK